MISPNSTRGILLEQYSYMLKCNRVDGARPAVHSVHILFALVFPSIDDDRNFSFNAPALSQHYFSEFNFPDNKYGKMCMLCIFIVTFSSFKRKYNAFSCLFSIEI